MITDRAKNILLQPSQEWQVIVGERTTTAELYQGYIAPLAAIGPLASMIGVSLIGISVPFVGRYRVPIGSSILQAIVTYVLSLIGVYILAFIIDALAPTFSGQKSRIEALKLAAYSSTAASLAGIFGLIPAIGFLGVLGLYSLYLLYLGVPVLMKVPQDKSRVYTIAVVVAAVVIFAIIGAVSSAVIPYPTPNLSTR